MKEQKRKSNIRIGIIAVIMLLFGGCYGDRMIASVAFKYYCSTLSGFNVHEKVGLGNEYFLSLPEKNTKEYRKISRSLHFDDELYFNKELLKTKYQFDYLDNEEVFSLGPIVSQTTRITRMSDKQVLVEIVGIANRGGWLADLGPFPPMINYCPKDVTWAGEYNRNDYLRIIFNKN